MHIDRASTDLRRSLFTAAPDGDVWSTEEYRAYEAREVLAFEKDFLTPDVSYQDRLAARLAKDRAQGEATKLRQKLARTVTCPTCGAQTGTRCLAANGRLSTEPHKERIRAAKAAL